jgi:hypothetical protein
MKKSVICLTQQLNNSFHTYWDKVQHLLIGSSDEDSHLLLAAYARGKDVDFGAVVLSQEGVCLQDDIIPWRALRSVRYENRQLVLVKQFGNQFSSLRVSARQLRNLPILLNLLEQNSPCPTVALVH